MTDVNIAIASSSSTSIAPSIPVGPNMQGSIKRELGDARDDNEAPEKSQKIMSICVGQGAADKLGRLNAADYKEDLEEMAKEYKARDSAGEYFAHIRSRNSSNRDLRALSGLTQGVRFHRINLQGKFEESIITNSSKLASLIVNSKRRSTEDVVRELEKEVRGDDWSETKKGFEQHMLEEDLVNERWRSGEFEGKEICRSCNNENAWNLERQCCRDSVIRG